MSRRTTSAEVAIVDGCASGVRVLAVSDETYRWAQRDCAQEVERRAIRKPFPATIEKTPNLCGPVLRLSSARRGDAGGRRG